MLIGYCSKEMVNGTSSDAPVTLINISETFGYIGIAMFAFEGNGVILNLRAEA